MYYICQQGGVALAIEPDTSGFGSVIGMSALQSYFTVFDRTNQRIGFAKSTNDCGN
jgi:hypothetical protein